MKIGFAAFILLGVLACGGRGGAPLETPPAAASLSAQGSPVAAIRGKGSAATPAPPEGPITVHLNQAIQMADDSVPIVAGRTLFFQVFMNQPSMAGLPVRAEVWDGHVLVTEVAGTMPADLTSAPLQLKVPGASVVNGYTYQIAVGPTVLTGTFNALTVPRLPITVVPLTVGGLPATVDKRRLEANFLRLYPVPDSLDIQYLDPVVVPGLPANPSDAEVPKILQFLHQKRIAEHSGRLYYGLWHISAAAALETDANGKTLRTIGGLSVGETAIGRDVVGLPEAAMGPATMAHELAHTLGLTDISLTGRYPYPAFEVLGFGADILELPADADLLCDPALGDGGHRYDLMAYADPQWISDYHYKHLMNAIILRYGR
jgi:hypothetical protein